MKNNFFSINYDSTPMGEIMKSHYDGSIKRDLERFNDREEYEFREKLDEYSDILGQRGFVELQRVMKEAYHNLRYLATNTQTPKDLSDYVDWKYTNPDLKTY